MPYHLRWTHCGRWNETPSTFHYSLYTIGLHHWLPKYLSTPVKLAPASPDVDAKCTNPRRECTANEHGAADVSGATEAISARYMEQRYAAEEEVDDRPRA
jgi:hypothetical protein